MPSNAYVALSGPPRSGKDSVADHLIKHYGYHRVAFADAIRAACANALGMTIDEWARAPKDVLRPQLQGLGHNARWYDADFWIKKLGRQIEGEQQRHQGGYCIHGHDGLRAPAPADPPWVHPCRIVVTDCRYVNEVEWLRGRHFTLIRLDRPADEIIDQMLSENPMANPAALAEQLAAPSEHDLDALPSSKWDWMFISRKGQLHVKIAQTIGVLSLGLTSPSRAAIETMRLREEKGLPPYA